MRPKMLGSYCCIPHQQSTQLCTEIGSMRWPCRVVSSTITSLPRIDKDLPTLVAGCLCSAVPQSVR